MTHNTFYLPLTTEKSLVWGRKPTFDPSTYSTFSALMESMFPDTCETNHVRGKLLQGEFIAGTAVSDPIASKRNHLDTSPVSAPTPKLPMKNCGGVQDHWCSSRRGLLDNCNDILRLRMADLLRRTLRTFQVSKKCYLFPHFCW